MDRQKVWLHSQTSKTSTSLCPALKFQVTDWRNDQNWPCVYLFESNKYLLNWLHCLCSDLDLKPVIGVKGQYKGDEIWSILLYFETFCNLEHEIKI